MKNPVFPPKNRRAHVAILGLGALAWLGFMVFRVRRLLRNGAQIAAHSQSFPRDYHLGDPHPGDSKTAPLNYVVMGDSTAAGWGASRLEGTYPYQVARSMTARGYAVHVVNIAVGGAQLEEVRRLQLPQLSALRPDFITLSVGANDATHFTPEADFAREMRLVLGALQQSPAREVLLGNTPDMALSPALPLPLSVAVGRRARRQNCILQQILRDQSAAYSKIRRVDLFGQGKLDYQRDPTLYAADLFHPSARGYRIWADVFRLQANENAVFPAR